MRDAGVYYGSHITGLFTKKQTEVIEIEDDGESLFDKRCKISEVFGCLLFLHSLLGKVILPLIDQMSVIHKKREAQTTTF
jgi:hypothetical protein